MSYATNDDSNFTTDNYFFAKIQIFRKLKEKKGT